MKKRLRAVGYYFRSHVEALLALVIVPLLLVMVMLFQLYLRSASTDYLLETTHSTSQAYLNAAQRSVNYVLKEYIRMGSEFAIRTEVLRAAERYSHGMDSQAASYQYLMELFGEFKQYTGDGIVNLALATQDGLLFEYDRYSANRDSIYTSRNALWESQRNDRITEIFNSVMEAVASDSIYRYAADIYDDVRHPYIPQARLFHLAFPLTGGRGINSSSIVMVITFRMEELADFMQTSPASRDSVLDSYIIDEDGVILFHQDESAVGMSNERYLRENKLDGDQRTLYVRDWRLAVTVDTERIGSAVGSIYRYGYLLYALVLLIGMAILGCTFRWILRPVTEIVSSIDRVKQNDMRGEIPIRGVHELWQLAEEYNRMIALIRRHQEEKQAEYENSMLALEKQHRAQWSALEGQINAHFILNTLGVINYEAMEAGNGRVSLLIKKLSNILRYTLSRDRQEVFIEQELEWTEEYLFLQKSRLGDAFDYKISLPDKYRYWPCCKLMLQPFVENSILHGFKGRDAGGMLTISCSPEGDRLRVIIRDNGRGMTHARAEEVRAAMSGGANTDGERGIGISNAVARMRLFYGGRFEIALDAPERGGASFTLRLPIPESFVRNMDAGEEDQP